MNFFKKLFSDSNKAKQNKLLDLLRPMMKEAVQIHVQEAGRQPADSNLRSQFGGMPYLESASDWPTTKSGNPLHFVFQIFNNGDIRLPDNLKLLQFFYDFEESAWSTDDDGWKLNLYETIDASKAIVFEKPITNGPAEYCQMKFQKIMSLPDWDGINSLSQEISDLCSDINDDEPWEAYDQAVAELVGDTDFDSQIGGYPKWIQADGTPTYPDGTPTPFLLQIDSEELAGLMWGDSGMVYFFYNRIDGSINFELQCF